MADTPLMRQYREMKASYADMVLFFRLGDFYEMFDEDAVEVSSLLNLTLTHKGDSPMCGIPFHAARNYIKRLLELGKKIAVCEQTSIPADGRTLAKREVVRIITPATVVDEDFLGSPDYNFVLSVFRADCAYCDISTGDFILRPLDKDNRIQALRSVIEQISPREILVCDDEYFLDAKLKDALDGAGVMVTKLPPWHFTRNTCYKLLCEEARVNSLASFGIKPTDNVVCPAGALMRYVKETSMGSVRHLTDYRLFSDMQYVGIDESSRRNLELFSNLHDGSSRASLFSTINRCRTYGGTRLLRSWISSPLRDISQIRERQDHVRYFYENGEELKRVRNLIHGAMDLNRLTTRVFLRRAVPHDLTAIRQSVLTFIEIVGEDPERYRSMFTSLLCDDEKVGRAVELAAGIGRAVNPEFLGQFNAGEVILDGYDSDLDEKRQLYRNSDEILRRYLEEEKTNSGLTILKLGYNRVFGYYLEVPNGQLSKVPDYFIRRQTLVNGERFTTEKLRTFEHEILSAQALAEERERELYRHLLELTDQVSDVLNEMGSFMNLTDVYQALATLAVDSSYTCPEVCEDDVLEIEEGRHPVVEKMLGPGKFVPNDLDMSVRFSLITGPNMAGKSTYLRQNALIILLAHAGSFVPAKKARIGLVDRIFCRVGASDNLSGGESTFLVEMQETAFILRTCTSRSFVIVDEIGRGTSTQDGMSIAWAVMKNLSEKSCRTLFATHYHELTMVDTSGIRLLTLQVEEKGDSIVFLRKVCEGVANSSYGIHVAKMAGVPNTVIRDARSFQNRHFADYGPQTSSLFTSDAPETTLSSFRDPAEEEILRTLRECNTDSLTPIQAMLLLSKLGEDVRALPSE